MIEKWENILEKIKQETDARTLTETYTLKDNFSLMLTANANQKQALENMLEQYPKNEYFDKTFEMFGCKRYLIGETVISYKPTRHLLFTEIFEDKSKTKTDTNVTISFHPEEDMYDEQAFGAKKAVIQIAEKVMEMKIPFVTCDLISKYTPNQ